MDPFQIWLYYNVITKTPFSYERMNHLPYVPVSFFAYDLGNFTVLLQMTCRDAE